MFPDPDGDWNDGGEWEACSQDGTNAPNDQLSLGGELEIPGEAVNAAKDDAAEDRANSEHASLLVAA